jgi:hypothetical protein
VQQNVLCPVLHIDCESLGNSAAGEHSRSQLENFQQGYA